MTENLRLVLAKGTITATFIKKVKCSPYLMYFTKYLNNTLIGFSCTTFNDVKILLPLIEHHILVAKIHNNIYSMNNISQYLYSHNELVNYCETYQINFLTLLSTYSKTLKN